MPIGDLPAGEWTPLLIGDQWPSSVSLDAISSAGSARQKISSDFSKYVDELLRIKDQTLDLQQGVTADDARRTYERGASNSAQISNVNGAKSSAYRSSYDKVFELRHELTALAEEGNNRINAINASKRTLPEKIAAIFEVITEIKDRGFVQVAGCIGHISDQIRAVLNAQGIETSAQAFATLSGLRAEMRTTLSPEYLREEIARNLDPPNSASDVSLPDNGASSQSLSLHEQTTIPTKTTLPQSNSTSYQPNVPEQSTSAPTSPPGSNPPDPQRNIPNQSTTPTTALPGLGQEPLQTVVPDENRPSAVVGSGTPSRSAPSVTLTDPSGSSSLRFPSSPAPNSPRPIGESITPAVPSDQAMPNRAVAVAPDHLAENFNTGNQTGAPVSAGAEAIATAAASPVHSTPPPLSTHLPDAGAPTQHVFETAHGTAAPAPAITQIAPSPTENTQPIIAASTPTIAAPIAPAPLNAGPMTMPTPTPSSGLMAYGADLRPPVTTPAVINPLPPSTSPVSAPLNGSAPTGQPAVVRQQAVTPTAPVAAAAGVTERAVAATATGAAAGTVAADSAAQKRLHRLLDAVACQQPQLAWAIGDLEDGTTVLVTDMAGGWIPPNVDIPNGITLLQPADRRGDLTALLGPTTRMATHLPGRSCRPRPGAEHVAMSIRPRDVTAVGDLGWALAQATRWRDGLPRLAHTLAKAVTAQTGWLDSEAELLRDSLAAVSHVVMAGYPAHVDSDQVVNWQLLATIDALINGETTLAHYHFAWFQAHTLTREAQR